MIWQYAVDRMVKTDDDQLCWSNNVAEDVRMEGQVTAVTPLYPATVILTCFQIPIDAQVDPSGPVWRGT